MIKDEILDNLNSARVAHIAWVDKAKSLVYGSESITKNQLPLDAKACSFGRWFFNRGKILFCIMSENLLNRVDDKHEELHNSYLKIFKIYFKEEEKSFFILEQPKTITPSLKQEAEKELRNLENISEELIGLLNKIESNFTQIDDEDLKNLCR